MGDHKRLFRCSCPSIVDYCAHVLAVTVYLGMPIEHTDHETNLGHERKRKRLENKILKSGGKRPRRCDKENKYSSPYFTSNNNTSTANQLNEVNNTYSSVSLSISTLSTTSPLQNVSNLSLSSSNIPTPTIIKAVRFLSPTNLTVAPPQKNQFIVLQQNK
ncbi:unnamed protein product [Rotaria sp. Silwood1]|nr:unnamed protein product [Rotaria sp. Silwood1]CAF5029138.1 unnamed protein product [Rotaria sp. Silwood1]